MRLLAILLFAASPALADDPSAAIEVGRFGVMLDQATAIEKLTAPPNADQASDQSTNGIYRQLVATVLRYNVIAERLCRGTALPRQHCAGPFMPAWLGYGAVDDPARLRVMIDEAGERITGFWGDICATSPDPHLCDIE